jgi:AcrR family transcriptional regulator
LSSKGARKQTQPGPRFPSVRAPKPILPAEAERQLTARQRQLLDELEKQVATEGLTDLTMAEIAAQLNCSLRTLYGLAPSRDELVLMVVDRSLRRIGRAAVESLDPDMSPLEALRAYLQAANEAVQPSTVAYSRELARIPGAKRLLDAQPARTCGGGRAGDRSGHGLGGPCARRAGAGVRAPRGGRAGAHDPQGDRGRHH